MTPALLKNPNDPDAPDANPPMQMPLLSPDQSTANMEELAGGGTADLESHVGPHMNPMLHPDEEPSPQGPPPTGKEQFHNTMSDFGHRAEANRAAVIGLDPDAPDYLQKLSALQAQHGAITQEKARYQMLHPWGGPESAHPGILGKIGHALGKVGNVVGTATLGAQNMAEIPGSGSGLEKAEKRGEGEIEGGIGEGQKAAQTGLEEAQAGHVQAETGAVPANIEHTQAETENLKNKPGPNKIIHESDQGIFAVDPQTGEATPLTYQGQPLMPKTGPDKQIPLAQKYDAAVASGDTATANRLLGEMRQMGAANQPPQRPQQQLGVVDGKVVELKPGMALPAGTQSLSGDLAGSKPSADETRRADLARNMNENLDQLEDIVKRRPELFGPAAGRLTELRQAVGTSDSDVATLKGIKEWFGMASVGAHAMRNAQHVIQAGDAVFNGYHNSPSAILAAAKAARASVATFQRDAGQTPGSAPKGGRPPTVGGGGGQMIRARDPQGKLHEAPAGTKLPEGWKAE